MKNAEEGGDIVRYLHWWSRALLWKSRNRRGWAVRVPTLPGLGTEGIIAGGGTEFKNAT